MASDRTSNESTLWGVSSNTTPESTGLVMLLESTGELKVVTHGKDSSGNIDPLRTNASQQLQVEVINAGLGIGTPFNAGADPAATTNTALVNVAAATTTMIATLTACNRSTTAVAIRVGIDRGGNGTNTPGASEWIYHDLSIAAQSTLVLDAAQGLWLAADDDLVVYATAQQISFFATGIHYA